jgi:uncharacterized protein
VGSIELIPLVCFLYTATVYAANTARLLSLYRYSIRSYLFPCVQFTRAGRDSRWCIGNLESGIDPQARQAIHDESEADKVQCLACALKTRCLNTCGCLNWQATGSINTVSPVLCMNERILMPIVDGLGESLFKRRNPEFLHKHYNSAYPFLSLIEDQTSEPRRIYRAGKEG